MKKKIILSLSCILLTATLFAPCLVNAQSGVDQLKQNLGKVGAKTNLNANKEPIPVIASIINIVLGFLGVLAIIFIIYAGFKWMTAQGNEQQVTDAKTTIKNAVIGIIIVMLAWIIVSFVINNFASSSTESDTSPVYAPTGACTYSKFLSGTTCELMTELQCAGKTSHIWVQDRFCPEADSPTGRCILDGDPCEENTTEVYCRAKVNFNSWDANTACINFP